MLVEPLVCIQALIAMKKPTISVPLICAALGYKGDLAACRFAELRLVIRGQDFYFLNCVRVDRDVSPAVVAGIDIGSTIDGELMLVSASTIYVHRIETPGT